MKKIILLTTSFFATVLLNAQTPILEWAKQMEGTSYDAGHSIAIDAAGNVCTTGEFQGTVDFDPGPGIFNLTSYAFSDIFITKLDALGNFVWAKKMGGGSVDNGSSITLDASGNVYTTGWFNGIVDFDPGIGIANLSSAGSEDVFISKIDSSGNFVWAKKMGGTGDDYAYSIFADAIGNVYTTGIFNGIGDFDPGIGIVNLTSDSTSTYDIFISKLDSFGNFIWAKNIGGKLNDVGRSIAVDTFGNVYTTGQFAETTDFDPGLGIFNLSTVGGIENVFISKLDSLGNFVWAKNIGGSFIDRGQFISLDESGNVYSIGYFSGTADFDPGLGVVNLTSQGGFDIFISKLDSLGNFVWAKEMGGVYDDFGLSVAIDAFANIYTTGWFYGTVDFDPGVGTFNLISSATGDDMFISKLDANGNFVWATNMGGTSDVHGNSIALDVSDNIYTTGMFYGTADFDPESGIFNLTSPGSVDIFVQKLSQPPTGINEATNSNNISIYPNPNNGTFNISFSSPINKGSIEVYNSIGALVYKQEITNQENSIELLNQANGLYFVKVMSENKIVGTGKIIKE